MKDICKPLQPSEALPSSAISNLQAKGRQSVIVRLTSEVANRLRAKIPAKSRSAWIEGLIVNALQKEKGQDFVLS